LDIYVQLSDDNAEALCKSCHDFGLGGHVEKEHFLEPGAILRFGVPPMRLEILNTISGVTFEECWNSREVITIQELPVPLISLPFLLKNKRASGRTKDQLDVEQLGES
jgi:hypothetical protein